MKTTIIDLLNKIANGKELPKRILYKGETYHYIEEDKDYYNSHAYGLFDSYVIPDILNDEVTILETTIKPDLGTIIGYKKGETDNAGYIGVVDKINEDGSVCLKQDKIEKLIVPNPREWLNNATLLDVKLEIRGIEMKINEIIDKLNNGYNNICELKREETKSKLI